MLKPKKKLTKKDIKQDPFLEKVDKAEAYFEDNRQKIFQILAVALALFIGYQFISNSNETKVLAANSKLSQALVAVEKGDKDNAVVQFESLIQEYASTDAGEIGHYYLGKIYFDQNNFSDAKNQLLKFVEFSSMPALVPPAYIMLAAIALNDNSIDEAISLYTKGKSKSTSNNQKNELSLYIAHVELSRGNIELARSIAQEISNQEFVVDKFKNAAQEILGQTSS
ncbi:MAG: tetratricopeptide repeat protein [Candidatus Marinimicrobia bacterium]|nr:tetratricopeptide repeat protein [Candidatus Neomarinimicrobiota bacterium]